jgi:predicted RNA-binding protein YlxR (DUF448 family)
MNNKRRVVLRTCVVTKEQFEKKDLLRIVKNNEGLVFVDTTGKANGRGAYIKKDLETLELAKKNKALDRALETTISDEVYEEIEKIIKKNERD